MAKDSSGHRQQSSFKGGVSSYIKTKTNVYSIMLIVFDSDIVEEIEYCFYKDIFTQQEAQTIAKKLHHIMVGFFEKTRLDIKTKDRKVQRCQTLKDGRKFLMFCWYKKNIIPQLN